MRVPVNKHTAVFKTGDVLLVREKFKYIEFSQAMGRNLSLMDVCRIKYKSDDNISNWIRCRGDEPIKIWQSEIKMPKSACRLEIRIVAEPCTENIQSISRESIRAEGISLPLSARFSPQDGLSELHLEYKNYWNSIHKPPNDWNSNPLVNVYKIEVTRK